MLSWSKPSPRRHDHHAQLDRSDEAGIRSALVEAWAKFLDDLDGLPTDAWSILVVYLEVEVGSVLLYPSSRGEPGAGAGRLSVSLVVGDWAFEYGDVAEVLDGTDDQTGPDLKAEAKFQRGYNALLKGTAESIKVAISDPSLAPRFRALKRRKDFGVY